MGALGKICSCGPSFTEKILVVDFNFLKREIRFAKIGKIVAHFIKKQKK